MKIINYTFFGVLLLIFATFSSCKKLVEVGPPTSAVLASKVFSNDGTAITAQFGVYAQIGGLLNDFDIWTGLSADELINYSTSQYNLDLYHNALNAQFDGGLDGIWHVFYLEIYQENMILENVPGSTGMSDRVKQLMVGEAKFMRAWLYFQLVNMFGDVPMVTASDYTKNSTLPRAPMDSVYNLMVSDLQSAKGQLSDTYLDASDNPNATDRVRPTVWAAHALLARAYLYMGKYDQAALEADTVIAHTALFSLVTDLTKVFKMNSTEAIWQMTPPIGNTATYEGDAFVLTATPDNVALSTQVLDAFEPNDARRVNWVNSYSDGVSTWYYPFKYRDSYVTSTVLSEYSMVLRLAEIYLIRAEARLQNSDAIGAVADLNTIRHRAGLPDYSGPTDPQSLLAAIAHERQVELFTEEDRWFDLKRKNAVDSVMTVVTPQKGGIWNSYQQLYPLYVSDLQFNPNLVQNQGY